jgi:hypothetical protein
MIGRLKLILSKLDFYTPSVKDLLSYYGNDIGIFCSQLIAAMYMYCGLTIITNKFNLDNYQYLELCLTKAMEFCPADFKEDGKFERILTNGVTLGKEIEVK